eukprot:m.198558 g.198558  ORF g.198558 m.198558 type:complete len:77 (-) comp25143_c0_seq1:174-404(-)
MHQLLRPTQPAAPCNPRAGSGSRGGGCSPLGIRRRPHVIVLSLAVGVRAPPPNLKRTGDPHKDPALHVRADVTAGL